MAKFFFEDPANAARLEKEWREWIGTPFAHYSQVKKGGADCVGLCDAIFFNTGALDRHFNAAVRTGGDYQGHRAETAIAAYLRGEFRLPNEEIDPVSIYMATRFAELPVPPLAEEEEGEVKEENRPERRFVDCMAGDVFLIKWVTRRENKRANGYFHMPIITRPATLDFIHALDPAVAEGTLRDRNLADRVIAHFRLRHV